MKEEDNLTQNIELAVFLNYLQELQKALSDLGQPNDLPDIIVL